MLVNEANIVCRFSICFEVSTVTRWNQTQPHGRSSRQLFWLVLETAAWTNQSFTWTELSYFFKPAVWLAVYSVADALWKTVMSMDGMLAIFLTQLSHLLCTVQPVHHKKQPFTETELSPIFRWTFLARWVLCGRRASKKCDLQGRNSRHFFLRTFWSAFAVPPYTQITTRISMISQWKRFHFRLILRSFWGPKWSHGPIPSFWDQSGIQGALTSKMAPFGATCFWTIFGPLFNKCSFLLEKMRNFECTF